ncbi:glycoside hydrolase family 16 protein [uncultured Cellulomonas sp.]|uniref:glycoside hydrolase family 16 protein n=1 Tax=uncultured Cellulomonas sp. TaxID=189682 RepID=UPI0026112F9C|nr:glycoside hydrolase family 16 protein [uncultured Cellulomonas sp.]
MHRTGRTLLPSWRPAAARGQRLSAAALSTAGAATMVLVLVTGGGPAPAAASDLVSEVGTTAGVITPTPPLAGSWALAFADEFTGSALDRTKWTPNYIHGGDAGLATLAGRADPPTTNLGNQELQAYVPAADVVADGSLRIVADRAAEPVTAYGDNNGTTWPSAPMSYTSGIISSHRKYEFTYGLVEFSAKMPAHGGGKGGLWPAVWMLSAGRTWPPEVDLMEWASKAPDTVFMNNIYAFAPWNDQGVRTDAAADWSGRFHHFALDWQPTHLRYYVDGVLRHEVTDPARIPQVPMYLLANLAVGGTFLGPGRNEPEAGTPFPATFELEYMRVWKAATTPAPATDAASLPPAVVAPAPTPVPVTLRPAFWRDWRYSFQGTSSTDRPNFSVRNGIGSITTPARTGYGSYVDVRTTQSVARGEYRYDFHVDDKADYTVAFSAAVTGAAPTSWSWYPQNGYVLRFTPGTGPHSSLTYQRAAGYALTKLGGPTTLPTAKGDVIHVALRPGTGAFVWKNSEPRPIRPTIATADATYTGGAGGIGYQGGPVGKRTLRFSAVSLTSG